MSIKCVEEKHISLLKPELVPTLRSKNKNLAIAQENGTKSAIKLSTKLLFYLIA